MDNEDRIKKLQSEISRLKVGLSTQRREKYQYLTGKYFKANDVSFYKITKICSVSANEREVSFECVSIFFNSAMIESEGYATLLIRNLKGCEISKEEFYATLERAVEIIRTT